MAKYIPDSLRGAEGMLILMACAMAVSLHGWFALLNNFVVERANFTGVEIGILQSVREVPGFLSFAAVLLLPFIREQNLAFLSLAMLGVGTMLTGYFPSVWGLYATTLLMSIGFHYYETMNQSLTLQLVDKKRAPLHLASQLKASSIGTLGIFIVIMVGFDEKLLLLVQNLVGISEPFRGLQLGYEPLYILAGLFTLTVAVVCKTAYPYFEAATVQTKSLILRRKYWLYYALTFMGGARRQIFMVFAAFLMVEKFGYDVTAITLLYLINLIANIFIAPYIGRIIALVGERRALIFEYVGLIAVFTGYAFVDDHLTAAALYIIDHLFFAFAMAIKTYFQKIADPKDIASTAGVSFTINHIAAVGIPAAFGFIWLDDPGAVFLIGAGMAIVSLALAFFVPRDPDQGNETTVWRSNVGMQPAE